MDSVKGASLFLTGIKRGHEGASETMDNLPPKPPRLEDSAADGNSASADSADIAKYQLTTGRQLTLVKQADSSQLVLNRRLVLSEQIKGMSVEVMPSVHCTVCLTECYDSVDKVPVYTPNNRNCTDYWHVCCGDCLPKIMAEGSCPSCREPFILGGPLMINDTDLEIPLHLQPEFLICPGCDTGLSRSAIANHLINCEKNRETITKHEDNLRSQYINYLKERGLNQGVLFNQTDKLPVALNKNNDTGAFEQIHGKDKPACDTIGNDLHNAVVDSEHQIFMSFPTDRIPCITMVQFDQQTSMANGTMAGRKNGDQLRELSSIASQPRLITGKEIEGLRSMPGELQHRLHDYPGYLANCQKAINELDSTLNQLKTDHSADFRFPNGRAPETHQGICNDKRPLAYAHAFTVVQHSNQPIALSFQISSEAIAEFKAYYKSERHEIDNLYVVYGVEIPNAKPYWSMQKVKPDRRIVIEADKDYKLIGLETMTRQEEAEIHHATGQSVRESGRNSIKYSFILATTDKYPGPQFNNMYGSNQPPFQRSSFGGTAFGNFGQQSSGTGLFGDSGRAFGQPPSGTGLFGSTFGNFGQQSSGTGLFGASGRAFGQSPSGTSLFGGQSGIDRYRSRTGLLGSGNQTGGSLFGSSNQTGGSLFGSSNSTFGNFGQQSSGTGLFGASGRALGQSPSGTSLFGGQSGIDRYRSRTGLFGSSNQTGGSLFSNSGSKSTVISDSLAPEEQATHDSGQGNLQLSSVSASGQSPSRPDESVSDTGHAMNHQVETGNASGVKLASNNAELAKLPEADKRALSFESNATIKSVSDVCLPEAYRGSTPTGSIQLQGMFIRNMAIFYVDALNTPIDISSRELPIGLMLEATAQQRDILNNP